MGHWLADTVVETLTMKQHALVGVIVVLLGHLLPAMCVSLPQPLITHLLDL